MSIPDEYPTMEPPELSVSSFSESGLTGTVSLRRGYSLSLGFGRGEHSQPKGI